MLYLFREKTFISQVYNVSEIITINSLYNWQKIEIHYSAPQQRHVYCAVKPSAAILNTNPNHKPYDCVGIHDTKIIDPALQFHHVTNLKTIRKR